MRVNSWDEQLVVEFDGLKGKVKAGKGPIDGYASRNRKLCAIVRVGNRLVGVPLENLKIVQARTKSK